MGELTSPRGLLDAAVPAIVLFGAVLLMAIPLRLFQGYVPTPILPLLVVFLYGLYEPEALPAPVVFAMGLLHDFLYGDVIGVWASVYLTATYLIVSQRTYFLGRQRDVVWAGFVVVLVITLVLLWLEMSLLSRGWLPIGPATRQFALTGLIYPFCAYAFFKLRARRGMREDLQL